MKANAGGTLTGDAILGREEEIAAIWERLSRRSVVLTAERRVGKTSVLRKMSERPADDWVPLLCLVESKRHPVECVETILSPRTAMSRSGGRKHVVQRPSRSDNGAYLPHLPGPALW